MGTENEDIPKTLPAVATAPPLPADDPRLTPEAIAHRRDNHLVERDELGRLLPGSQLPGKGRKVGVVLITTLARRHTEAAIAVIAQIVEDPKAPPAAKVAAATALLDRGWGKAPSQIDLNGKARFDGFLREVGIQATYAMEHPELENQEIGDTALGEEIA